MLLDDVFQRRTWTVQQGDPPRRDMHTCNITRSKRTDRMGQQRIGVYWGTGVHMQMHAPPLFSICVNLPVRTCSWYAGIKQCKSRMSVGCQISQLVGIGSWWRVSFMLGTNKRIRLSSENWDILWRMQWISDEYNKFIEFFALSAFDLCLFFKIPNVLSDLQLEDTYCFHISLFSFFKLAQSQFRNSTKSVKHCLLVST